MSDARKRLGAWIKARRLELQKTQSQLANDVAITHSFISLLENGLRAPSLEVLERLAIALHVQVGDLFADVPSGSSSCAMVASESS